jgi:hypothetical protein
LLLFSSSLFSSSSLMPQLPSFISLSDISIPTLGISVLVCTVIAYTVINMLGFGRKNEFPVEGRVSSASFLLRNFVSDLDQLGYRHHRWLRWNGPCRRHESGRQRCTCRCCGTYSLQVAEYRRGHAGEWDCLFLL